MTKMTRLPIVRIRAEFDAFKSAKDALNRFYEAPETVHHFHTTQQRIVTLADFNKETFQENIEKARERLRIPLVKRALALARPVFIEPGGKTDNLRFGVHNPGVLEAIMDALDEIPSITPPEAVPTVDTVMEHSRYRKKPTELHVARVALLAALNNTRQLLTIGRARLDYQYMLQSPDGHLLPTSE